MQEIIVSIIIVNYHVKKELFNCIESIIDSSPKSVYEIIVVDNDESKKIQQELKQKFPKVIYIPNENKGFGQANNIGSKHAKGEYLFFLNPDTLIFPCALDNLVKFLQENKNTGIVAPLLHDMKGMPYQQGTMALTPVKGIICLSWINKIFPYNSIAQKYFLNNWDKKTTKEVDVAPGTAFMIRNKIFEKLNGFDEKFFLYFEEFDICKRVKALGWKIFIYPPAKVVHAWGSSTRHRNDIKSIFLKSRFYYFRKYFGILTALFTEAFLRVNKYTLLILLSLIIGFFLRSYRIYDTMPFIGDQGWFYISARDSLVNGKIPLVGIATSHPWLHQGALWTYLLSLSFIILGYSPYTGVYISIILDILAIFLIYKLGSLMFSQKIGIISGLMYAASPIVIFNARMPYHTSPIPLLTIFYLLSLARWIKGKTVFFPVALLSLVLLYNFEIATFPLSVAFLIILFYGFIAKKKWAQNVLDYKIMTLSFISFGIPMLPMLIYDFDHGFPQTFGFLAWIGYKILVFFGYTPLNPVNISSNFTDIILFILGFYNRLIFLPDKFIAIALTILSFGYLYKAILNQIIVKKYNANFFLLGLVFTISFLGIIATRTTSDAYLPILFPSSILIIALFLERLLDSKFYFRTFIILFITVIFVANFYLFMELLKGKEFQDRFSAAKKIVSQAGGRRYNLIGEGRGSQFRSFTMNYEYLTWWLGYAPSKKQEALKFIISESEKGIKVRLK